MLIFILTTRKLSRIKGVFRLRRFSPEKHRTATPFGVKKRMPQLAGVCHFDVVNGSFTDGDTL